ncbi:UNVERIFIED_CONTAM: hypothetical protein PYX00_007516 [Menopon gallinae]|uniref:Uncharacterized protein n=1 Tax=Menopon gallinae TaxID=328185 RepID=A0AAW2HKA7_9NEOP
MTLTRALLPILLATIVSGGDEGRDPCKMTGNGFGLICSNVTSEFFASTMFLSLDDDIARFSNEVRRLEIQRSNLTELKSGSFKRMPFLSYLIIANVSLKEIERGAFEGLTNLKMADLSHNRLSEMPVDAFRDTRISHLSLEGNLDLQVPTNGPILKAKKLRSLVMKRCNLQHLPGSAFTEVLGLSYLDLSQNRLEMLPRDLFAPLKHLDYLDLSDNQFGTIDFAVFTSIPSYPSLPSTVVLSGNRWTCDCRLAGLIRWATRNGRSDAWTSVATISRLRKRTFCNEPALIKGDSWNDVRVQKFITSC